MRIKRIQATVIAGLLLLMLILPQLALAQGPGISNVSVTDITATTATITWTTNTTSNSRVNYGTTTALGKTEFDSVEVTHHYITLTRLDAGKIYYFEVKSDGERNPVDVGAYYSFTTLTGYSITLDPDSGVYGDLITVTAAVAAAGTYHICWDSCKAADVLEWDGDKLTFTATTAGSLTLMFSVPNDTKGSHKVCLATDTSAKKKEATFEVYPTVKIKEIDPEDEDPMVGPVGTKVTISCYGFKKSQGIRVKFHGEVIKTGKTNNKGSWTVSSYTIPATPGGDRIFEVEAKEDNEWVHRGSEHFTVTPQITVTPDSGTVGQAIEVKGTGFASEEEDIEVTFDGEVRAENIPANVHGSWTANIIVPIRTCDDYIINASGKMTRARDVDYVEFTVVAGIAVTPALAYVGDEIIVTGGGFAPGENGVRVTFDGTVVATDIPVDVYGCWQSSFTLSPSTYGPHAVSASGETTAAVTTTLDTQARITGLNPVNGAPGDSVTLTGSGFSSNRKLTVTLGGRNVELGDVRSQTNGNVNITFRVPKGSPEGKQKVVVTDEGGATPDDDVYFTVKEKTISTTPLPISPEDSTLRSGEVTFRWQGATGSTGYTYTLEINTSAGPGNIWSKSGIEVSSYTLTDTETVKETLKPGTYYWRVKIVDDYGNEGAWSDYIEFTVSPIPNWVWVVVGLVVLVVLMVVAYRETKFKVTE